ncbi:TPR_11 domain-containing protein [Cephalotus follicularis]|uniref:TPR_11 domain-containing protein n=1 Tax=Cephalotus follicularis TaxID=3775 RepID=A0A1Q3CQH8_CEPFO|nr:TPR_11 domain-containing protein [Cephalotus follicularis]
MLLRSASTPILNSWIPQSTTESDTIHHMTRIRSGQLTPTTSTPFSLPTDHSIKKMTRALSDTDLRAISAVPKKKPINANETLKGIISFPFEERECGTESLSEEDESGCEMGFSGAVGGGGGKICGSGGAGGGSRSDGDGKLGSWDSSNNGNNNSTDLYYQKMIDANPANSLLLSNYATFLKEVRGDYVKAEKYFVRAILANPQDGNVLSMYADLVWQSHKDASRAETYFDQAVKVAPDDW